MADRETVIKALEYCVLSDDCRPCEYWMQFDDTGCQIMKDALVLLQEQDDETKRIMKVVWDTLHEGLSIDTVADQDWVYERIRHRIEDSYESCHVYKIKGKDGMCTGGDEQCNECPCFIKFTKVGADNDEKLRKGTVL